jgi:beta-lactamase class A
MSTNKKLFLVLVCFLILAGISYYFIIHSDKYKSQEQQKNNTAVTHTVDTPLPYTLLNNVIAQSGAGCSVYYKSLTNGDVFYNYSGQMPAAGMLRPFIMAKVMADVEAGDLKLEDTIKYTEENQAAGSPGFQNVPLNSEFTVGTLLENMLVLNDNTATNLLIDVLGQEEINEYLKQQGYVDTVLNAKLGLPADKLAKGSEQGKELINYTSVNDLVNLFAKIYSGKCVSTKADKSMLELLARQKDKGQLGALLPKEIKMAHQSGEAKGIINDCAIIYAKDPYILAVMTDRSVDTGRTLKTVNQISSIIHNAVTDKEVFKK